MQTWTLIILCLWSLINIFLSAWILITSHQLAQQTEALNRWTKRLESRLIDRMRI